MTTQPGGSAVTGAAHIFTFGSDDVYQLGNGPHERRNVYLPEKIDNYVPDGVKWKYITCGRENTMAISTTGSLYGWGLNLAGQLGMGERTVEPSARLVEFFHKKECDEPLPSSTDKEDKEAIANRPTHTLIADVACGRSHSIVCTSGGKVWSFGEGVDGVLGIGVPKAANYPEPQLVPGLSDIIKVYAGVGISAAIDKKNQLFTWGRGSNGRLGHGDDETLWAPKMVQALKGKRIIRVSFGLHHAAAVSQSGELFVWGSTADGVLGFGEPLEDDMTLPMPVFTPKPLPFWDATQDPVATVACGDRHTVFATQGGHIYVMGRCTSGRLGLGRNIHRTLRRIKDLQLRGDEALSKQRDADGENEEEGYDSASSASQRRRGRDSPMTAKQRRALAKKGRMDTPRLLVGRSDSIASVPTHSSPQHGASVASMKSMKSSPATHEPVPGQVLPRNVVKFLSEPVKLPLNRAVTVRSLRCGASHTMILDEKGNLYTFGDGEDGQLGLEMAVAFEPQRVRRRLEAYDVIAVACGERHSAVLTGPKDQSLGYNSSDDEEPAEDEDDKDSITTDVTGDPPASPAGSLGSHGSVKGEESAGGSPSLRQLSAMTRMDGEAEAALEEMKELDLDEDEVSEIASEEFGPNGRPPSP